MMNTMEDKSLCGLIKFHSARLAEVAKDTEELQASIDNEVAEAYQKGFEDGKAVNDKGCEGCKYQANRKLTCPCSECANNFKNQWTAKDDKIEVGDEVEHISGECKWTAVVTRIDDGVLTLMGGSGAIADDYSEKNFVKTGRHFDIASILEEMRHD